MSYWERNEKLFKYVDGVRQYFPLAQEQLTTISRIIDKYNPSIESFLDLGCGDGFLGNYIYQLYPNSNGVFLDISHQMILKAKEINSKANTEFMVQDFGNKDWGSSIEPARRFDLIISGFAIHHIENEKKKRLYNDIFQLLKPNGIFLNLEHVASSSENIEEVFDELFEESMKEYHNHINDPKSKEQIKEIYHDPEHKKLNKLEAVEIQCVWLKEIGFTEVDCYLKILELALFGGIKPNQATALNRR